jgi:hypothetical protein
LSSCRTNDIGERPHRQRKRNPSVLRWSSQDASLPAAR